MIDALWRGGGLALLLLLAVTFWRAGEGRWPVALACLCGAAYLLSASAPLSATLGAARWPVFALAAMGPFWFLVATRRAFGAPASLDLRSLVSIAVAVSALAVLPRFLAGNARFVLSIMSDAVMFGLFLAALYSAWRGLGDDLVPRRRSMRLLMLTTTAAFGALIAVAALLVNAFGTGSFERADFDAILAATVLLACFGYCAHGLRLADTSAAKAPARRKPMQDGALVARLRAAFEIEKMHRRPELTLSVLARELCVPEHQARLAINTELGFKNFSAFVNSYRIAEIKQALADPGQNEVPISTIALDAGFGSIASFNRAFRAAVGASPTEFRASAAR